MIKIEIPSQDCIQRNKSQAKGGGVYYLQTAYAHTFNRDGTLNQYPEKLEIYTVTNDQGVPQPYPVGDYTLDPTSFYVKDGRLQMFTRLKPMKQQPQAPVKAAS